MIVIKVINSNLHGLLRIVLTHKRVKYVNYIQIRWCPNIQPLFISLIIWLTRSFSIKILILVRLKLSQRRKKLINVQNKRTICPLLIHTCPSLFTLIILVPKFVCVTKEYRKPFGLFHFDVGDVGMIMSILNEVKYANTPLWICRKTSMENQNFTQEKELGNSIKMERRSTAIR